MITIVNLVYIHLRAVSLESTGQPFLAMGLSKVRVRCRLPSWIFLFMEHVPDSAGSHGEGLLLLDSFVSFQPPPPGSNLANYVKHYGEYLAECTLIFFC